MVVIVIVIVVYFGSQQLELPADFVCVVFNPGEMLTMGYHSCWMFNYIWN